MQNNDDEEKKSLSEKMQETTQKVYQKVQQAQQLIELAKKLKALGPIISAVAPFIGYILLAILIIIVVILAIAFVITNIGSIVSGLSSYLNFVTLQGWTTDDKLYFKQLQEQYKSYGSNFNTEGNLDIPLLAATAHYQRLINPDDLKAGSEVSDADDSNYTGTSSGGFFDTLVSKAQLYSFYKIAADNLGEWDAPAGIDNGLAAHLVDLKLGAGDTCYSVSFENAGDAIEAVVGLATEADNIKKSVESFYKTFVDYVVTNNGLNYVEQIKMIQVIEAYAVEKGSIEGVGDWVSKKFSEMGFDITDDNAINTLARILKNSDFTSSCGEGEIFIPKIKYYINYDRYEDYLKKVYFATQPYASCANCEYKHASDARKDELGTKWFNEIMAQKKTYDYLFPMKETNLRGASSICPSGIQVRDGAIYNLEEYVAGVVLAENAYFTTNTDGTLNIESAKAQAIAARTYALQETDFCKTNMTTGSGSQNFKYADPDSTSTSVQVAIKAATETAGMYLAYTDNTNEPPEIFSSEYDAFCASADCNDSDTCTASYEYPWVIGKIPSTHTFEIPSSSVAFSEYKNQCDDTHGNDGGHGRGMSQEYANYMQTQGFTYEQILRFAYGEEIDGVYIVIGGGGDIGNENYSVEGDPIIVEKGVFTNTATSRKTSDTPPLAMNPVFENRVTALINGAATAGYTVAISGGWRSYTDQATMYGRSAPGTAACPGGSNHGFGIAADLTFDGTGCKVDGKGSETYTDSEYNCNDAARWVHIHAADYQLKFPMDYEPWHVQPLQYNSANFGACTYKN